MPEEVREKIRQTNIKNRSYKHFPKQEKIWQGTKSDYLKLHTWIRKTFGDQETCEECHRGNLTGKQIHWANMSVLYRRRRSDWLRLCAKCHKKYDLKIL